MVRVQFQQFECFSILTVYFRVLAQEFSGASDIAVRVDERVWFLHPPYYGTNVRSTVVATDPEFTDAPTGSELPENLTLDSGYRIGLIIRIF